MAGREGSAVTERSLSAALSYVAADLDNRGYPFAGTVRRGARVVAELESQAADTDVPRCPSCGGEVQRVPRGRPATYCSRRCRNRARYRAKR